MTARMLEAVDSERELLDRLEGGDEAAVDALFDLHAGTLRAYARRWLPRRLDRKVSVADVMQEARLVALRRSGDFQDRGENAFRNWLLRIVEYKVKEEIRRYGRAKRAVQREITRGARPVTADFAVGGPSPSEAACGNEQRELAEHAMAQLTDYQRDVLRLSCEEHLTFREIAARLGHSYESVKKTYGRAVSRFSEEFERLQGDGCE